MTHTRHPGGTPPQTAAAGGPARPFPWLALGCTVALLGLCAVVTFPAHAGPLADPTRPPAALSAPGGMAAAALPHRANLDTARAIAAAARLAQPPAPAVPSVVQAVQLPANGPAAALVDGKPVKVGDLLDGRTVLAIDAQGLLLKGQRVPERLWLLVGNSKQAAGSITDSQVARFQPEPSTDPGDTTAAATDLHPHTQAVQTPVSLAKRTAP